MRTEKQHIDPLNIFSSLLFLGHHNVESNGYNNKVEQINFAKKIAALLAGITECLRLLSIVITGLWSLINSKMPRQERFCLSYYELCSLTMFAIYSYFCFIFISMTKRSHQNDSSYLALLAGEYIAGFLVSTYFLKKKIRGFVKISVHCSWYTEVLLALLCHQKLTDLESLTLSGKIGNKEIFQLNQLRKAYPNLKIRLKIGKATKCFDNIKSCSFGADGNRFTDIMSDVDFVERLKILILVKDIDNIDLSYCRHLITLLRIWHPKLSITAMSDNKNFWADIPRSDHRIEIKSNVNFNDYHLVFFRGCASTIIKNNAFSRFVYFYEPGARDENTLAHLGKQSVSLDITTLQRKPLSNQSFELSEN